jgi:hypothetical protein
MKRRSKEIENDQKYEEGSCWARNGERKKEKGKRPVVFRLLLGADFGIVFFFVNTKLIVTNVEGTRRTIHSLADHKTNFSVSTISLREGTS